MNLANLTLQEFTEGYISETDSGLSSGNNLPRTTLRRCRTREHGSALMTVGHAIEYLLHSRIVKPDNKSGGDAIGAEREALAILLHANLSVYNEGAEIVPLANRLRHWFRGGNVKPEAANASF